MTEKLTTLVITMKPLHRSSDVTEAWLSTCDHPYIAQATDEMDAIRERWIASNGRKWIHLDGANMQNLDSYYSALTRAFKLPDYFGKNLNALNECLTDYDVLSSSGIVIYIENPSLILGMSAPDASDGLLDTFADVAFELSQAVSLGHSWDRPAIPFHVLIAPDCKNPRFKRFPLMPF